MSSLRMQGPIRRVAHFNRYCSPTFAPQFASPVVMGPCVRVRRDDFEQCRDVGNFPIHLSNSRSSSWPGLSRPSTSLSPNHERKTWITGTSPLMTADVRTHPRGANCVRVMHRLVPQTRAQGMPDAQPHPQKPCVRIEKAQAKSPQVRRTGRHSPRDGFTTYSALSPAIGLFVTVVGAMHKHRRQLRASVEALRPHGFVVQGLAHSSLAPARVRRIPHPTFVTIAKRPSSRVRNAADSGDNLRSDQCRQLRHIGTTGKSVAGGYWKCQLQDYSTDGLRFTHLAYALYMARRTVILPTP
jgi:hypothetical protein